MRFPAGKIYDGAHLRGFASPRFALSRPGVATLPIRADAFAQRIHQVNYIGWFFFRLWRLDNLAFSPALHEFAQRLLILVLEFLGIKPCCFALKNMRCERNHILLIRGDGICEKYSFSFRTS